MRVVITEHSVKLWLSANDTWRWATKPGARWPCSELNGNRLFAEFDETGLIDMAINGRNDAECDATEFNACTSDHIRLKLPKEHPAYFAGVGQFLQ